MYEENKVRFNWKSFLLKLALIILIAILVIKFIPFNKNNDGSDFSENFATNNLKFKNASYDYYMIYGASKTKEKITLEQLEDTGIIEELKLSNGKTCDKEKSYIQIDKKEINYEVEMNLVCGKETNKSFMYIEKDSLDNVNPSTTTTPVTSSTTTKKVTNKNNASNKGSYVATTKKTTPKQTVKTTSTQKYAVIFNSNGGSIASTQYVVKNAKAYKPLNPSRTGFTFAGWYYNGKLFDFNSRVNSNIILKAVWIPYNTVSKKPTTTAKTTIKTTTKTTTASKVNTYYTVTFKLGNKIHDTQTVKSGSYASKPSKPKQSGATFAGWYSGNKEYKFNKKVTSNIVLTARFIYEEETTTNVYSAIYMNKSKTSAINEHTLRIPSKISSEAYNISLDKVSYVRGLKNSDYSTFINKHGETYKYSYVAHDYHNPVAGNIGYLNNIKVKIISNKIDKEYVVNWTGNVSSVCNTPFSLGATTGNCVYGIIYKAYWSYEIEE